MNRMKPNWKIMAALAGALLFLCAPLSAEEPNGDLPGQVRALHESLMRKDIASRYTRADISRYFAGRNDLDNFIVTLFAKMDEADFSEHQMDNFAVGKIEYDAEGNTADVTLEIEGPWFVFFDTDFEMTEKWILGPDGWRLALPTLVNLPVR